MGRAGLWMIHRAIGEDGVLGEVSGLAHAKVQDLKVGSGNGQVDKTERAGQERCGETRAKRAGGKGRR